jgi:HEAT repeat protein
VAVLARSRPAGLAEALVDLLPTIRPALLSHAVGLLGESADRNVLPAVRALLDHPDRQVQAGALGALATLSGPDALDTLQRATRHSDPQLRIYALKHLAERGDATSLPLFVEYVTSSRDSVAQEITIGIERFGTSAEAAPLYAALRVAPEQAMYGISDALRRLTFASDDPGFGMTTTYKGDEAITRVNGDWERWLRSRGRLTRAQWAEGAIRRASTDSFTWWETPTPAVRAIAYLSSLPAPPFETLRRVALTSPSWRVRVEAARALAAADRSYATTLLVREFGSRYIGACWMATQALRELAGTIEDIECTNPASRAEAAASVVPAG